MKVFRDFKNKKDLLKELSVYKEIILKKSNIEELNSALNKTRSALTLIKEFQDKFELDDQLNDFNELNNKITTKLKEYRDVYVRRLHNLLKEQVDETSLENLMKLLVMLKTEVDKVYEIYNLQDLQEKINHYFSFIKRLYVILSSYETVNFHDVSENIFNFIKDLEFLAFPK